MNFLLIAILFFVLSPGILLTIPPGKKGLFFSGQTSVAAAIIHAIVFVIVCCILRRYIQLHEGFEHCNDGCNEGCNYSCNEGCNDGCNDGCNKGASEIKETPKCKPPPTEKERNCISKKERTWSEYFFGEKGKIYSV